MSQPSLRRLLFIYETFFVLLVFMAVFVGLGWSYFWLKWSQETVRLAEMSRINENLGRLFLDDLGSLRKKNYNLKPDSLEGITVSLKNSVIQLDQLRRLSSNRAEDYAVQDLQVAASYVLDFLSNYQREWVQSSGQVYSSVAASSERYYFDSNPLYPEQCFRPGLSNLGELACFITLMKRDFHFALISLRGVIEKQRFAQEDSKQNWSKFGPLALLFLIFTSIVLWFLSRRGLHRQFWFPLQAIVADSEALLEGRSEKKLPEVGAQEMRFLASEINLIADALDYSREQLKSHERQAALAKLVPVIAHNVKNPLASIRANAQLLEGEHSSEEVRESRVAILSTVDKLTRWINSLVSYLHPVRPRLALIDFREVAEGAAVLLAKPDLPKNITMIYENWDKAIEVLVDLDLMEQAVFCLLSNAIDASPKEGKIKIGFEGGFENTMFYIEDEGTGLPFNYQPAELEPGLSTKEFGTGLGLPIVQKVCDSHGFTFDFKKPVKAGAKAVIHFRVHKPEPV